MNHSFDIEHAAKYGLHEAILIANFQFWIAKNRANGRHQHHGRTWTYNSARALSDLMPYLSDRQIRRTLDSLVELGVLVKGNFNASTYDRTLWFAFADECMFQIEPIHSPKSANRTAGNGASQTDINTDEKPDSESIGGVADPFVTAWAAYPRRAGNNSKSNALKAWNARITDGVDPLAMIAGVERYATFCKATNKIGTEFVMQGQRFFGPSKPYEDEWTAPANDNRQARPQQRHIGLNQPDDLGGNNVTTGGL